MKIQYHSIVMFNLWWHVWAIIGANDLVMASGMLTGEPQDAMNQATEYLSLIENGTPEAV